MSELQTVLEIITEENMREIEGKVVAKKTLKLHTEADSACKSVMTVPEISKLSGYNQMTVHVWIGAGYVSARKAGGVWLVSVDSLRQFLQFKDKSDAWLNQYLAQM